MQDGILVINKPKGITSRDVVNEVCKKLKTKHVGHTGTLDPIAEGVLVLGINNGCKIIELLTSTEKEYIAEVKLGIETDTLDVTGNIIKEDKNFSCPKEKVEEVLKSFLGKYDQTVPIYSAVRINGKRLYEYARNNEEVCLPKREVEIKEIELLDYNTDTFKFRVVVSKGTYIRSLIRDIGEKLELPCCMQNLLRTRQGNFTLDDSILLEEVENGITLKRTQDALLEYDKLVVDKDLEKKVKDGAILENKITNKYLLIFNEENEFLAIYQTYEKDKTKMKPYKVF